MLSLRRASANTKMTVDLEQTRERTGSGGYERTPRACQRTSSYSSRRPRGMVDRREHKALEHTDVLSLLVIPAVGSLDQELTYTDPDEVAPSEYCHVGVRQIDGGLAWSSPAWVGEGPGGR